MMAELGPSASEGSFLSQQDLDRVAMPPPAGSKAKRVSAQIRSSPDSNGAAGTTDGLASYRLASGRLAGSTAPKPHYPTKAIRRSPSSSAIDPDSSTEPAGEDPPRMRLASFSSTHAAFRPPPSLALGSTTPARPPPGGLSYEGLGQIAVPTLSPVHLGPAPGAPSSSPLDDRIPGIATRSRSIHVANPTSTPAPAPRPGHKLQRSLSTPGTLMKSTTSSPPLDESPSDKAKLSSSTGLWGAASGLLGHNRHPSNSTSSVGPNVAGRIGVGGNVMVDPHSASAGKPGNAGAGAFVYKVYNMLLDPSFQHLIAFNDNGQSFTVCNVQDFSKVVLPKHFKHNNFSSFVRQLNMYGFHKVNKTPRGTRGQDTGAVWEFVHPKFHRGKPELLDQIRRKAMDGTTEGAAAAPRKEFTGQIPSSATIARPQPPDPRTAQAQMYHLAPPADLVAPFAQPKQIRPPPTAVRPPSAPATLPPEVVQMHMAAAAASMPPLVHNGAPGSAAVPVEAYHAMQHELLAHLHAMHESHEAMARELFETRRREQLFMEMAREMHTSLNTITQGHAGFPFPSRELLDGEVPPTFQITDHDPSQVITVDPRTQQPVSVSASPANSDFSFHPAGPQGDMDRRVSIDPATYGAFGSLALSSNPGTPSLFPEGGGSPFATDDAAEAAPMSGANGWRFGSDGLLAPAANTGPPLSPGAAFSTAIGTPLPPSPMPFANTGAYPSSIGLGVEIGSDSALTPVDSSMYLHESPLPSHLGALGGDSISPAASSNDGPSFLSASGSGTAPTTGDANGSASRKASPGRPSLGEEFDIAGLLQAPPAYQNNGKGAKKRPATGSMDLNIQPAR